MKLFSALVLLCCACAGPTPCPPCPDSKCNCTPDTGVPLPPIIRADAAVIYPHVDAGTPVVCTGCQCPTAEPAKRMHRHLFRDGHPATEPHEAVCPGADSDHPGRKHCTSRIRHEWDVGHKSHHVKRFSAPSGFGPADLASAYKLPSVPATNALIAIVDAYGYKNAESDLAAYRKQYGLPACTVASGCLKIVNQNGKTSPLPPNPPADDDWTVETALDLDLASAACPNCKLLLVQAQDDQSDGLYTANNAAVLAGATVISNSWGSPESGSMLAYEAYFNHPGVTIFVAAGDDGYDDGGQGADYPSTSAYVVAVGGTSLVKDTSSRGWSETAWTSGGSSCSTSIGKPSWQTAATECSGRAASDVSAVGDPNTGLAVYNHANGGWIVVGGTSASSPFVAGVYALTGHGAVGPAFAYQTHAWFDVTSGSNGGCGTPLCTAGIGWDGPTGLGTPNGAVLMGSAPPICPTGCCK